MRKMKPVTFTIDPETETGIQNLNRDIQARSGLLIGESFIVRVAMQEFLRNRDNMKIVLEAKARSK